MLIKHFQGYYEAILYALSRRTHFHFMDCQKNTFTFRRPFLFGTDCPQAPLYTYITIKHWGNQQVIQQLLLKQFAVASAPLLKYAMQSELYLKLRQGYGYIHTFTHFVLQGSLD